MSGMIIKDLQKLILIKNLEEFANPTEAETLAAKEALAAKNAKEATNDPKKDVKVEITNTIDTLKWVFIGIGIFVGLLLILGIIYWIYSFFTSQENVIDSNYVNSSYLPHIQSVTDKDYYKKLDIPYLSETYPLKSRKSNIEEHSNFNTMNPKSTYDISNNHSQNTFTKPNSQDFKSQDFKSQDFNTQDFNTQDFQIKNNESNIDKKYSLTFNEDEYLPKTKKERDAFLSNSNTTNIKGGRKTK